MSQTRTKLYLEDVRIGQRFISGPHTIDEEQIIAFAREFDPQPFHLDPEAAKDSFFQGLAASGWHTVSITMRLIVEATPFAAGAVGAGAEVSWLRPVRPGETLHVEAEVVDITPSRSKPDRGIVTVRNETHSDKGDVVQIITSKIVVPRRMPENRQG
jgi:acyl dehydratase